jgi:hypothetical protein
VEELTDKPPTYEIGCQSDFYIERPSTPRSIPVKVGCDVRCQIEDNDLFDFNEEVEPILTVLCGKTLEASRMEVLEEEELKEMRAQQKHFKEVKDAEIMEI